jgi:glycosyltransferase involved in cell wall biosynthesis
LSKKKIIIIGPAFPLRGGIADSNHSLALALQSQGHEVLMLSFSLQYPSFLFPGKSQFDFHGQKPKLNIETRINSVNPISWLTTALWLSKQNPDVVITRYWLPFMGAALGSILRLSKLKGKIPLIALCDNVIPHEHRIGDSALTNYFLKANNSFLVMSKSVEKDIYSFLPKAHVNYHPHPVYDQFGELLDKKMAINELELGSSKRYILFFGFVRKYKGLDLLLNAMPEIHDDIELIVAGEFYEAQSEYTDLVKDLGVDKRVHFFSDFIEQDKVNLFFSASDMVVQPYRTATQSGVAQIAYHFNKPILVTNVGGLPEIVPHEKVGYVVDVNSTAISNAVNDFYDNNKESVFIENIKIEKLKYSWDNMALELINNLK